MLEFLSASLRNVLCLQYGSVPPSVSRMCRDSGVATTCMAYYAIQVRAALKPHSNSSPLISALDDANSFLALSLTCADNTPHDRSNMGNCLL